MKIAVAVHGRFHAFDLSLGLQRLGHDVSLFTNYPKTVVGRWDVDTTAVHSFVLHGILLRTLGASRLSVIDRKLHETFATWLARNLPKQDWDVVHSFSGVARESFIALAERRGLRTLLRGSSHIRTQHRLLVEEQARTGSPINLPQRWYLEREEEEYALADRVVVLSTFAKDTFVDNGVPPEKLWTLPLGVRLERFKAPASVIEQRAKRIASGDRLRILFVGAVSARKGIWDLIKVIQSVPAGMFDVRLVGPSERSARAALRHVSERVELVAKVPEVELRRHYEWADVFLFPTIEDGFAAVLLQAHAAALPIITTTNCAGPDFIREGRDGWVTPIRRPDIILEKLMWCHDNREELATIVLDRRGIELGDREWLDVAREFAELCRGVLRP